MTFKVPKVQPFSPLKHRLLAPVSRRHRRKLAIVSAPIPIQLIARDIIMTDDQRLLYVKNAKAGCSSVAHLLFEYSKGYRYDGSIHKHGIGQLNGFSDWALAENMLQSDDVYRFTTVRDPVARAISCFRASSI